MADRVAAPPNLNTVIIVVGFVLTLITTAIAGASTFFSLRGDVGVVASVTNKLAVDVAAIQQLIITRSADRYTKQDAQRDQDIIRERFVSMENRLVSVENRGIERDKNLDQLQRTLSDISGALRAVRPVQH